MTITIQLFLGHCALWRPLRYSGAVSCTLPSAGAPNLASILLRPPAPAQVLRGRLLHAAQGRRAELARKQRAGAAAEGREPRQQHLIRHDQAQTVSVSSRQLTA